MARGDLDTGSYWNFTGRSSGKTRFDFFYSYSLRFRRALEFLKLFEWRIVLHKRVQGVVFYLTKCTSIVPKSIFTTR